MFKKYDNNLDIVTAIQFPAPSVMRHSVLLPLLLSSFVNCAAGRVGKRLLNSLSSVSASHFVPSLSLHASYIG